MTEQTGGDLLAESLIEQGVSQIFGIPGVQLDGAADALYSRADRIAFTCARNEQATTYMADGYARSTGDVGVAMVVPGPGVLNALSGMATAYSANSPEPVSNWWPRTCHSRPWAGWRSMVTPFAGCRCSGITDHASGKSQGGGVAGEGPPESPTGKPSSPI